MTGGVARDEDEEDGRGGKKREPVCIAERIARESTDERGGQMEGSPGGGVRSAAPASPFAVCLDGEP